MWKRKELTEQQNWVIVNNEQIVEHYSSFKDAVKDRRGHLMTEVYYRNHYVNKSHY